MYNILSSCICTQMMRKRTQKHDMSMCEVCAYIRKIREYEKRKTNFHLFIRLETLDNLKITFRENVLRFNRQPPNKFGDSLRF